MMVILISILLTLLIAGFLAAPLWLIKNRPPCPPDQLARISQEIEQEIRAFRTHPEKHA